MAHVAPLSSAVPLKTYFVLLDREASVAYFQERFDLFMNTISMDPTSIDPTSVTDSLIN